MAISLKSLLTKIEEQIPGGFEGGKQRLKDAFSAPNLKETLYQMSPFSMKDTIVPSALGTAEGIRRLSGKTPEEFQGGYQVAEDLGYGMRGAMSLTPMQSFGLHDDPYAPTTARQKTAEDVGQAVYGSLLAAGLTGGPITNVAKQTLLRAGTGATLNTAMAQGSKLIEGGGLLTPEELKQSAIQGVENSWILAFTGFGLDKALAGAGKMFPSIAKYTSMVESSNLGGPFALLKNASPEQKWNLFGQGALRLFTRAGLEVLPENTAFTFMNKLDGNEKRSFMEAWVKNLPGSAVQNLIFAGLQTVGGGTYNWHRNEIDGAVDAFKSTLSEFNNKLGEVAPVGLTMKPVGQEDYAVRMQKMIEDGRAKLKAGKNVDFESAWKDTFSKNYTDQTFYQHLTRKGWSPDQVMEMANRVDYILKKNPGVIRKPEALTYYFLRQAYKQFEKPSTKGLVMDYEKYQPNPAEARAIARASQALELEMRADKAGVDVVRIKQENPSVEEPVVKITPEEPVKIKTEPVQPKVEQPKVEQTAEPKAPDVMSVAKGFDEALKHKEMSSVDRDNRIFEAYDVFLKKVEPYLALDKKTLYQYMQGKIEAPSQEYVKASKILRDVWLYFSKAEPELKSGEVKKMNIYTPDYSPEQIIGSILEDYPTSRITSDILELHHLKSKTDPYKIHEGTTLEDVVKHRLLSGIYNIYRNAKVNDSAASKVEYEVESKIVDHINKTAEDPSKVMDYVQELGKIAEAEEFKKVTSDYDIKAVAPGGDPLRTDNDLFSKIGGDLFAAFKRIRDYDAWSNLQKKNLMTIIKSDNPNKTGLVINYINKLQNVPADLIPDANMRAQLAIKKFGLENYVNYKFRHSIKNEAVQNFLRTVGRYEFTSGRTRAYINKFVDAELKGERAKQDLGSAILDRISQVFSLAQIGGNIKVALTQLTEVNRMIADYNPKQIAQGFIKGIGQKNKTLQEYGFEKQPINYEVNFKKKFGDVPATVGNKLKNFLFMPLQYFENMKNAMYAGAAEAKGREMGLKGDELFTYVRDSVFKLAHPADYYNTPVFMKNSALYRSALQYSQFGFKNIFEGLDAAQQKEARRLAGLLTAQVATALEVGLVTGYPLAWIIQNLVPAGLGPIASVPIELYKYYTGLMEAEKEGKTGSANYNRQQLQRMLVGNFIPAGTQYNKSRDMYEIMSQGFADTPSGNVKYLAPSQPTEIVKGFMFGTGGLNVNKDFKRGVSEGGMGGQALGKTQSENVKNEIRVGGTGQNWYNRVFKGRQDGVKDEAVKDEVISTGLAMYINGKLTYPEGEDSSASIDVNPYLGDRKGGLEGMRQKENSIKTAVKIYELDPESSHVDESTKKSILSDMGYRYEEIVYESSAGEDSYVKSEYLYDLLKDKEHSEVLTSLLSGRVHSLTGKMLANNETLATLRDKDLISQEEYKWLIKQEFDSTGKNIGSSAYEEPEKLKKIGIKSDKPKAVKISEPKISINIGGGKAGRAKASPPKIDAPNLTKLKVYSPQSRIKISDSDFAIPKLTVRY